MIGTILSEFIISGTNHMHLEIREFDGDFDWLRALEELSFCAPDQMSRDELVAFRADPANRILLLGEGEVRIGAMLLTRTDDGSVYLESIALHPAYRSAGRGGKALAMLIEKLGSEGCRRLHLHVRDTNPSRRMYERLGFVVIEEVPGFYPDRETAIYMQRFLSPPATLR